MLRPAATAAILAAATVLSGCSGLFGEGGPAVSTTQPEVGMDAWNTDNRFRVVAGPPAAPLDVPVRIVAEPVVGSQSPVMEEGRGDVTLEIPDGIWKVTYYVDGDRRGSVGPVRIDTTAPLVEGLELVGDADSLGTYTIGASARVEPGSAVEVVGLESGQRVATSLPATVTGLGDGLHAYLVSARDEAGNAANHTVQVRVGDAALLPEGQYTFGVVARYTNEVRLWDISDLDRYLSTAQAQQVLAGRYLGKGQGIDPDDAAVRDVVGEVVEEGMSTAAAALALYVWLFDNLEYDETRLESSTLLTPRQVLLDREDAQDRDADRDGLVDDGAGNGVKGGICRDLAATYVSLLRAAGVPARLVSGYLAGNVNGFHAWVEFYGGTLGGQPAWIPVDVSPIDQPDAGEDDPEGYRDNVLLQAFAIQLPEYLALRTVPEEGEVEGWSTALSVRYEWPPGKPEPRIEFRKSVDERFEESGVLCVNPATRARLLGDDEDDCRSNGQDYTQLVPGFVTATERIIDYGIEVLSAPGGTEVRAEVAYPFQASVAPNRVDYEFYGEPVTELKSTAGKAVSVFER